MNRFDFTSAQRSHAPRAARQAFEQNLCAQNDDGPHICDMYDGHNVDAERSYRHEHHCECGHVWSDQ